MRFVLLIVLVLVSGVAVAAPSQRDLKQLEKQIAVEKKNQKESERKADALSGEVKSIQKQTIQLAKTVQEKESLLSALEDKLQKNKSRQAELEKKLSLTEQQVVRLVTGMQTLALRPKELVFMNPSDPINVMRSQMMTRYSLPIVGGLEKQVRADLAELTRVRSDLQKQIVQIKSTQMQLAEKTNQMDRLLHQKSLLQAQYQASQSQAQKRVQTLGGQAKDLKDLLAKLEKEKQKRAQETIRRLGQAKPSFRMPASGTVLKAKPTAVKGFAKSFGKLAFPIKGTVTQRFGDETLGGAHLKGMTITGRAGARVTAPFDGTVLFAGPFKSYGQLIIIDNGDNYLTLLAGMEKISPVVGQEVLSGEPVGQMAQVKPDLYLEIRKGGQAVDPLPWFLRQ